MKLFDIFKEKLHTFVIFPADSERKLNVHKTFNLYPVSTGF